MGIYLLAWHMQAHILLNWDVSWLMHASKRLLAGGSYKHFQKAWKAYYYLTTIEEKRFYKYQIYQRVNF